MSTCIAFVVLKNGNIKNIKWLKLSTRGRYVEAARFMQALPAISPSIRHLILLQRVKPVTFLTRGISLGFPEIAVPEIDSRM